jgi:hypothetical protein
MTAEEEAFALGVHRRRFSISEFDSIAVPTLADVRLRAPRIAPPAALAAICSTETYDRAAHAHGKGFTDAVRAMLNDFASAPDAVAYPANEQDIAAVMDWAGSAGAVLIPFGGGSSVVGGVTPPADGRCAISLDLRRLDKVLEIDRTSRAVCIRARTGLPCGISRRASSSPPWAAGSPRAQGGISRRSTRISTISWKAYAWSRQPARWKAADCPVPAPVRVRTGCSSARRASSA